MTAQPQHGLRHAAVRRLLPAAAVIWLERALRTEGAWMALIWLGYGAAVLFGLFDWLGGDARVAVLGAVLLTTAALLLRAALRIALPGRREILNRIEDDSRALRGTVRFEDAAPSRELEGLSELLWQRARQEAAARPVRLSLPRPALPRGLRRVLLGALVIALGGALLAAWQAPHRFGELASPYPVPLSDYRFQVRVTPPDYALGSPVSFDLSGGESRSLRLLAGGEVEISALSAEGDWAFVRPDGRAVPAATAPNQEGPWRIVQDGRTLAALDIELGADGAPVIRFDGAPARNASGALLIGYALEDDYGVSALALEVTGGNAPARLYSLSEAVQPGTGRSYADLSSDPRAGERALLTLVATDGSGNEGRSAPIRIELPVKTFNDPIAREIIEVRRELFGGLDPRIGQRRLGRIAARPERFDERTDIYAGLRSAAARLRYSEGEDTIDQVGALLWAIATDLEDGGASRALDDLRAAMDRLMQEAGSGDDEALSFLTERLEQAMAEYLRRQMEAALDAGELPPPGMMQGLSSTVDAGFLQAMMEDLKDRLAAGDTEGAVAALENLRGLMESIQFGAAAPDPEAAARAEALRDLAEQLQQAEIDQGELRQETIAEAVRQAIRDDPEASQNLAAGQQDLGDAAEAIAQGLSEAGAETPEALGAAQGYMQQAAEALARGDAGGAAMAQGEALRELANASAELEQQAQQAQQQASGGMMQAGQTGSGIDPLGRPGTGFGQGAVELPDEQQMRRVQEIRAILEERARDPSRSEEERSYYLRLLKRF